MTFSLQEWLQGQRRLLDGSTGTLLQRHGMPTGVSPEAFCLERPEILRLIQTAYAEAGSDMLLTPTFGANRIKLNNYGLEHRVKEINQRLAEQTLETARRHGQKVAGDVGPTGLFFQPFGEATLDAGLDYFCEQISALAGSGVDVILIETQLDIQEARLALLAAKNVSRVPVIVSMTFDESGRTLTGSDPLTCLNSLQTLGADAFGFNCSTGPDAMLPWIRQVAPWARIPLMVKPNAGLPVVRAGQTVFLTEPEPFAQDSRALAEAGAVLLGGCCGTTPDHIRALAQRLDGLAPFVADPPAGHILFSSPRRTVISASQGKTPLRVIGERINPTGKPGLQAELKAGRLDEVKRLAMEQARQGADLLDVNLGMPGIDEAAMMAKAVAELSVLSDLPLCIDSSRPEVIEAALRMYPGRALVNSLSGEKAKLAVLLPLLKKYGAAFIVLPLDDGGIPETLDQRAVVLDTIFSACEAVGVSRDQAVVDGLVMTVSSNPEHASLTLETLGMAARQHHPTVIGLSNISFGLPARARINAAFLAMAEARGLSLVIANPGAELLLDAKVSADLLTGRDPSGQAYIRRMAEAANPDRPVCQAAVSPQDRLRDDILQGEADRIDRDLDEALGHGAEATALVQTVLIPAIQEVGRRYDQRNYFLPQLIAAAQTMERGMAHLAPHLEKVQSTRKGVGVLATVKGDVHDIGKKIVALLLRNNGYEIIDMGKSVGAEEIVRQAEEADADFIGLSALMTTTMQEMESVIRLARAQKIRAKIILGGAVVTAAFAEAIGADGFALDAVKAVEVVARLLKA